MIRIIIEVNTSQMSEKQINNMISNKIQIKANFPIFRVFSENFTTTIK